MLLGWADNDIFWHLANGRQMVEQGRFPSPDAFSWTMPGREFIAYSAQVDRLFYLLWALGGAVALGAFSAGTYMLALLPYALLVGRARARPLLEFLVMALVAFAYSPYMGARPHVLAFVLFGVLIYVLEKPLSLRRAVVAAVCLGAWANVHGSFQVGFLVVGLGLLLWLWQRELKAAALALVALLGGATLSLLSPYGVALWLHPFESVSYPYKEYNQDWSSLTPFSSTDLPMGLLILLAVGLGVWRKPSVRSLAALGLLLPSIHLSRFTPFVAPLLGTLILERVVSREDRLRVPSGYSGSRSALAAWTIIVAALVGVGVAMPDNLEDAAHHDQPEAAVSRLLECGSPGKVWNSYNLGGYLLWRGGGEYKVLIDGRAETLYDMSVFDDYMKVKQLNEGWKQVLAESPARYILIETEGDAPAAIGKLSGWRTVHYDGVATLFVRNGAPWRCE